MSCRFLPSVSSQGTMPHSPIITTTLNFYANHDPPMEGQLWEELWSEDPHAVEERRQLREVQGAAPGLVFVGT